MDIYLDKNIIENLDLNNYDIATYVALRNIYVSAKEEFYISVKMLAYELFGCNIPRSATEHIKESIFHLADIGLFDIVFALSSNEFIINGKNLYFDTYDYETGKGSYFTVISSEEVRKIMTLSSKKDKFALLRFFINVIGTFNHRVGIYKDIYFERINFVGFMSQDYIGSLLGINRGVVDDYFKLLEKEKMLYVYRHNKVQRQDDGKIKVLVNHYGRYKDKEDIKEFAIQYEDIVLHINPSERANDKRSLMAKYNFIVSNPEKNISKYSEEELIDIYEYVSARNERQKALNLDDIKDLSVLEMCMSNDIVSGNSSADIVVWGEPDAMDKSNPVDEILEMFNSN